MNPWTPAPDGPPPDGRIGAWHDLHLWLDANPGQWAVVTDVTMSVPKHLARKHYEVVIRNTRRIPDAQRRCDVYVRKEVH